MLPVFKEYISFLQSNGDLPVDLVEGYYWLDNQIIKAFNKKNKIEKIFRINITDDLQVSFKPYAKVPKFEDLQSWEETYQYYKNEIHNKEAESLHVINTIIAKYPEHELILTTSKGKDSNLTEHLLDKIKNNYRKIFNNTTLDCADVYKAVKKDKSIEIATPKLSDGSYRSFYKMIRKYGVPSRHHRWCCTYFKEGATKQYLNGQNNVLFVMGMRNEESSTRSDYDFEWRNEQWTNKTWIGMLPIRKWTELELWLYTLHNNLEINSKYKKGYSRCGCHIACPFYAKSTWVLDKYWYPKAYERFHNILDEDFTKNEKWTNINCTQAEYHYNWNGGIVREIPTKEVVEEFQNYKGIEDYNVAETFFNKECCMCTNTKGNSTRVYKKDEIAMNLKLLGRNTEKFMCKKCLMKYLNITEEQWNEYIKQFKQQGCNLF